MASLKKSKSSQRKSSVSGKRPLKKRGPYKPRQPRQTEPESSPLADKLRERIKQTKAVLTLDSTSSPTSPPPPSLEPPDSELEKLRKEKEKADYAEREKVRKSKQTKKRGRPSSQPAPTKEGILALLRMPFQVGGAITGYAADPIHPAIEESLAESALAVLHDFGFEAFQKWINLGVFVALYGTCGLSWFQGLKDWAKERQKAAVEAKKGKIHDITPPGDPKPAEAV